jgi:uncharacterized membrane protein
MKTASIFCQIIVFFSLVLSFILADPWKELSVIIALIVFSIFEIVVYFGKKSKQAA